VTPIEELVRQALAETPTATTTTDPMAALDRRVRRARRWLAAGAGAAAAAIVAAVVVPLAVLGGNGTAKSVGVADPTPSTSPSASAPPGVTVLRSSGAISVSATRGEQAWVLYRDSQNLDDNYVAQVSPDGGVSHDIQVAGPADFVVSGEQTVWVVGSNDDGSEALISAVDPFFSPPVGEMVLHGQVLTHAVAVGDSLYVVAEKDSGSVVERFRTTRHQAFELASTTPVPDAGQIVATDDGHLWVRSGSKFVELVPTKTGVEVGATARWDGELNGAAGAGVWTYDDYRLDCLDAAHADMSPSLAQGCRLTMGGDVGAALGSPETGLYAAIVGDLTNADAVGIAWFTPQDIQGRNSNSWGPTDYLRGPLVRSMALDPRGGVDYVDDQGVLNHWDPASAIESR